MLHAHWRIFWHPAFYLALCVWNIYIYIYMYSDTLSNIIYPYILSDFLSGIIADTCILADINLDIWSDIWSCNVSDIKSCQGCYLNFYYIWYLFWFLLTHIPVFHLASFGIWSGIVLRSAGGSRWALGSEKSTKLARNEGSAGTSYDKLTWHLQFNPR